ncbi:polysaccharide biosynthesis/export protein [Mesorhizobium sp. URHB0026]|jgi:polysaccharide export outer membrane protein
MFAATSQRPVEGTCPVMKSTASLFRALLAISMLAGCSSYRPTPAAFHEVLEQPYRLGAGDRVRVTVFEQDGLTNSYSVDQSGYISFPLVGAIPARGHTAQQMEKEIADKLRQGYLRDPDVSVEIDRYRPIFVMGEVGAAGQYSYVPGLTVQKAIAIAGGFTPRANQESVDITRDINGKVITGRVVTSDPLLPGDTVYVRERLF